jgi:cytochrome c-type biogenesis protein CcmH/NrfG
MPHRFVATHSRFVIIRAFRPMNKIGSALLIAFVFWIVAPVLSAQSDDPSDTFLKAYMTAQQGEKLEHENQFRAALAKYRFAGSLIEQLRKTHPDWQPAIVEYRGRKVSEGILRVQDKAGTQESVTASAEPPADKVVVPPPPVQVSKEKAAPAPPSVAKPAPARTPSEVAIEQATKKLRDRVGQLEAELVKSRTQMSAAENEKQSLSSRLDETKSKLDKAQGDLEKAKTAEKEVREQLNDAQASLKKTAEAGSKDDKAQQALRSEVSQLNKALASAKQGRSAAEKERDDANAKVAAADQQRAAAGKERDDALAQLKGLKNTEQRVEVLIAENSNLKQKLADAEKTVREISADKPKKEQELADVRKQIADLQTQLATSQKQNKDYEMTVAQLRSQLDQASKQLDQVKLVGATPEETAKLTKENEMLRNIIVRERQEEARRDQAKKLMLAEFDKLQIKSETLTQQIQLLAQPVTRLTTDELALLRQPVVSISDDNPGAVKASFTFAKNTTNPSSAPTKIPVASTEASMSTDTPPSSSSVAYTVPAMFKPNVPPDVVDLAWEAKQNFDKGKYRSAEKIYQEILTKTPNNLYSLSNLGVVYFRSGKLKAAELTLKKAVTLSPNDEFTHTTLGIVYYRQAKFDSAITELTKSLGLNPRSSTAHNYLGITASQKGWQEAAEKELLEAVKENPNYADAHFNLAVIYATSSPPSREQAKQHYGIATKLGAQPDPSLEKLLH